MSKLALGPTQPPVQWIPEALTPGIKWHEADHSLPSGAKVKNTWDMWVAMQVSYVSCVTNV